MKSNSDSNHTYAESKEEFYTRWLEGNTDWFKRRLWQTMRWLHAEEELNGSMTFRIPHTLFKKNKVDLEEARKIIANLEKNKIVSTFYEINRTPPSISQTLRIGKSILEDEALFYNPDTEIILSHEFKYLYKVLEKQYSIKEINESKSDTDHKNSSVVIPQIQDLLKVLIQKYNFPKKQKRLLMHLKDGKQKDTKILKTEIQTRDLASLKRDTLNTIKQFGLTNKIKILSDRVGFNHTYQLSISPDIIHS